MFQRIRSLEVLKTAAVWLFYGGKKKKEENVFSVCCCSFDRRYNFSKSQVLIYVACDPAVILHAQSRFNYMLQRWIFDTWAGGGVKKKQNNNSKRKQSSFFSIWNSVFSVSAHYILYCHCSPLEWVCLHLSWAEGRGVLLPWPFYSRKPELPLSVCPCRLCALFLCSPGVPPGLSLQLNHVLVV